MNKMFNGRLTYPCFTDDIPLTDDRWIGLHQYTNTVGQTILVECKIGGNTGDVRQIIITN